MVAKRFFIALMYLVYFVPQLCAASEAGSFTWPVSPVSDYRDALGFIEFDNKPPNPTYKYHMGEDWNSLDGYDYGDPVYAVADGVVLYSSLTTGVEPTGIGKVVIIRHTLPDGKQMDSVFFHLKQIFVAKGVSVVRNQEIATIGDANGAWSPHLHFEIRRDLTLPTFSNPYKSTLDLQTARKYTNPSLFIDDRKYPYTDVLAQKAWKYISWYFNAPSSTAYVELAGKRYSLKRAADAGLIYAYVYVQKGGVWYYYGDINDVFFEAGNTYAIYSFVSGAVLNILVPGDRFRDERSRQDMINAAAQDSRFTAAKTETYGESLNWDSLYELRWVRFSYTTALKSGATEIYHATNRNNPLIRYTTYFDPDTGQQKPWVRINWNVLD